MATPTPKSSNSRMTEWVSALADNVKNPVSSFLVAIHFLEKEFLKSRSGGQIDFATVDQVLGDLRSRLFSLSSYIDELSGYSKPVKIFPQTYNAQLILEEVISELSKNPLWRGAVDIFLDNPDLEIFCDFNKFKLACRSILVNALEAVAHEKNPKIEIKLAKIDYPQASVRISISDNGPGIDPQEIEKIGDAFYSTKDAGTGLGISLTKKYVEAHKGEFNIKPHGELGGAEVMMTFPMPIGVAI